MKSPFVGKWLCQFYTWDDNSIGPTPPFPMTVTQESAETLDGTYPLPGHDAKMHGHLSHDGRLWVGTFIGKLQGTFLFIISENNRNVFHGAWVLGDKEGPPQPWWGYRQ